MRNLLIGASIVVLSCCQCCQMAMATKPATKYYNTAKGYSGTIPYDKFIRINLYKVEAVKQYPKSPESLFHNEHYLELTMSGLSGLAHLKYCKDKMKREKPTEYTEDGLEFIKKTVGELNPNSDMMTLGAYLLFFDMETANKEILRRLRAARNLDATGHITKKSMEKRTDVLLEYITLLTAMGNDKQFHQDMERAELFCIPVIGKTFIDSSVIEEMKPEMDYAILFQSENMNAEANYLPSLKTAEQRKEHLTKEMKEKGRVGADRDELVRSIIVTMNALLFSNIEQDDENSYYTNFIKALTFRVEPWILDYCLSSPFKMDLGARIGGMAYQGMPLFKKEDGITPLNPDYVAYGSYSDKFHKDLQRSKNFARKAIATLTQLDPQQSLRLARVLNTDDDLKKLFSLTVFEGQSEKNEEGLCSTKYINSVFEFARNLLPYFSEAERKVVVLTKLMQTQASRLGLINNEILQNIMYKKLPTDQNLVDILSSDPSRGWHMIAKALLGGGLSVRPETLFEFIKKTCSYTPASVRDAITNNTQIMEAIVGNTKEAFNRELAVQLIGSPDFCSLPELVKFIDGIDQAETKQVIAKALLARAHTFGIGYNVMTALSGVYAYSNLKIPAEIINDLFSLGDALKYMPQKLANAFVDSGDAFTFGHACFLMQHIDVPHVKALMEKTTFDLQNNLLEQLVILNRDYRSKEKTKLILQTLAEKQSNHKLTKELGGRLARILPPEIVKIVLELSAPEDQEAIKGIMGRALAQKTSVSAAEHPGYIVLHADVLAGDVYKQNLGTSSLPYALHRLNQENCSTSLDEELTNHRLAELSDNNRAGGRPIPPTPQATSTRVVKPTARKCDNSSSQHGMSPPPLSFEPPAASSPPPFSARNAGPRFSSHWPSSPPPYSFGSSPPNPWGSSPRPSSPPHAGPRFSSPRSSSPPPGIMMPPARSNWDEDYDPPAAMPPYFGTGPFAPSSFSTGMGSEPMANASFFDSMFGSSSSSSGSSSSFSSTSHLPLGSGSMSGASFFDSMFGSSSSSSGSSSSFSSTSHLPLGSGSMSGASFFTSGCIESSSPSSSHRALPPAPSPTSGMRFGRSGRMAQAMSSGSMSSASSLGASMGSGNLDAFYHLLQNHSISGKYLFPASGNGPDDRPVMVIATPFSISEDAPRTDISNLPVSHGTTRIAIAPAGNYPRPLEESFSRVFGGRSQKDMEEFLSNLESVSIFQLMGEERNHGISLQYSEPAAADSALSSSSSSSSTSSSSSSSSALNSELADFTMYKTFFAKCLH
ncbi:hypothetical protein FACS1894122_02500 [Alphaproteobacteria bacterium]|nr:hypothetical protein FACS1894122_02500 [Alphaproteobacteria bacterium]